ncbi:efflux RND transporter permease subunit [Helicobacter burdigaliensis]|uniref:efflux RND transporter permease subunit n=1 Tax=Helicobacter burdigaliensis TaxID=2315334 RepID=UPI000EF6C389|nr:MMPL family transporter [Helicobacter burdigaliensis]
MKLPLIPNKNSLIFHLFKAIINSPFYFLGILFAFFVFFAFFALKLPINASADSFILENDKDLQTYQRIAKDFKSEDFLLLAFVPNDGDIFSKSSLETLQNITKDLEKIPNIKQVISILNVPLLKSTKGLELKEILDKNLTLLSKEVDLNLAKLELIHHPFYKENLLSLDAKIAGILIYLQEDKTLIALKEQKKLAKDDKQKELLSLQIQEQQSKAQELTSKTIQSIKDLKNNYQDKLYLGGMSMIASDMISYVKSDIITYGGMLAFILCLMLWFFFRVYRFILLTFIACLSTLIISSGIFAFFGYEITVVSSNYVSLLLIINISLLIHLLTTYLENLKKFPNSKSKNILLATMLSKATPSFYAVLTTIIGFLSLVFSNIEPIIKLGIIMSIGVSISLFSTFIVFGAFNSLFPLKHFPKNMPNWNILWLKTCAKIAIFHRKKIYFISFLVIVFALIGIFNLRVENSFVNYFKDSSDIKQGLLVIDNNLGGTVPLEIILTFKEKPSNTQQDELSEFEEEFEELSQNEIYWFDTQKLRIAKSVHQYLEKLENVGAILSLNSLLELTNGLKIDSNEFLIPFLYQNSNETLKSQLFSPYVNIQNNELRFVLRTIDSSPNLHRNAFIKTLEKDLNTLLKDENVSITINGAMVLYNNLLQTLISSQVDTLSLVVFVIFLVFLIVFKNLRYSFIALFSNLIPLGIIFGIIGVAKIPLDLMGVTIAAISLGIGVDSAIHYIHRFKEEIKYKNKKEAIIATHISIGSAIYYTTLMIVVGFCAMMSSNFIPTIYFGFLTTLVMLCMLASSLFLLPSLLLTFYKNPKERL